MNGWLTAGCRTALRATLVSGPPLPNQSARVMTWLGWESLTPCAERRPLEFTLKTRHGSLAGARAHWGYSLAGAFTGARWFQGWCGQVTGRSLEWDRMDGPRPPNPTLGSWEHGGQGGHETG